MDENKNVKMNKQTKGEEVCITEEQLAQAFMEGYMYAIQVLQENIVRKEDSQRLN